MDASKSDESKLKDKDSDKISDLTPNDAPKSDTKAPSNESPPVTDTNAKSEPEKPVASDDKILQFVVIYSKEKYDVKMSENSTVLQLKTHLESIIGVPHTLQKVMYKGLAKNEQTLKSLGVVNNAKIMLVGSKLNDVLNLATVPTPEEQQALQEEKVNKEPWSRQKMHRTVLDKGLPDDVMPGILNTKEPLPPFPLSGMLNKGGGKLRITFRLELDELWLGTKERTEKIRMSSIKGVISEPIEGLEQYHIMALQLGTTDASRYWIYYVPAQYVDSIKHIILDS
ncbi:ubiquitin domain-containing protein UBFD1 isoform X1 [Diaphorina citri]|uniref:Ubiquitin domain-containing protein UBFD1 isoform X1 n=1 Tax=Diaphorina citri TaxID=121845 RepID=A0A1S3CW76_DIACI|nr:ubiquitin domain-containing protein UBFD1 isoform X1 [Diaphorina citri]XP_026677388.1 ubiquitin domain-containing protein UBFD1 isoform X1 [Diaphorina citri]XP_026677393.1 ubiquitin domain-containing protein UBFD1 isoform X1 [Diaphorina citri]KAI5697522.1 hypothetical protein M8J75_011717 [Diaphorina citri]KAI5718878.1 hypothetical protein M8J76_001633 [Diaphorina citri]